MRFIEILAVVTVSVLAAPLDVVTPVNRVVGAPADIVANADAAISNIGIKGFDVANNIGNFNKINVLRRNDVLLPANIDVIVLALIDAAVAAGVNVQAAVANIGINYGTFLSNIGNNNLAITAACAKVGVNVDALIGNFDIQNSSILTSILNCNTVIAPVRRNSVVLPANIDAVVLALIDAAVAPPLPTYINYSTLLSNIGNNNVVFIRSLPEIVGIAALLNAIADACAKVGVDVDALIANIDIQNSNILTDILNGNKVIAPVRRNGVVLPANIDAIALALIDACVALPLPTLGSTTALSSATSEIKTSFSSVRSPRLSVFPCAKVEVNVEALIGNIDIQNSSILTDILNGTKVIIAPARRNE
ncbi:hypothetical protein M422DRAFT_269649 [Sphaerobolus stellatus SS14]|uniref:Uncharacterized protein n=1 Tax=Sphaerobolus stellatus (strain SS14) TaxID=990650 RepID=A0A0C9U480_SPHS4|nr:hypothetical protein M422DRAFT_269649 [Sphaerobolus stellatus SS14]